MRRSSLVAAALAAVFSAALAAPALALSPGQLTPQEQQVYRSVASNPRQAAAFLATRDYVRKAQSVLNGDLPALKLPDKPRNFEDRYLFPGEADMVNKAVAQALFAMMDAGLA